MAVTGRGATISPDTGRTLRWGLAVIGTLLAIHMIVVVAYYEYGKTAHGLSARFDLGVDAAVPTWVAAELLLGCAMCLFALAWTTRRAESREAVHWLVLGLIFVLLSADEVGRIHEWLGDSGIVSQQDGFLYYSWIVFGIAFTVIVFLGYLPFLRRLEPWARWALLGSGALYVGGALVFEMINASLASESGEQTLRYAIQTGFEESLEFVGALLFLVTLIELLRRRGFRLVLEAPAPGELSGVGRSTAAGDTLDA